MAGPEQTTSDPGGTPPSTGLLWRVFDRATTPPGLTVFALLHAAAVGVTCLRYLLSLEGTLGPRGDIVTGDFMAFFTGATLIRRGQGRGLYDLALQQRTQAGIIGRALTYWQPYQNPPALALALAGVTGLAYVHAFYVYVGAMVAAMVGTGLLLRPVIPPIGGLRGRWVVAMLLVAGFQPVLRTMFGGQNTVLSLVLLSGLYASLVQRRSVRAGVFLGLLSYKPQLGSLAAVVLVAQKELLALGVAVACVALHYLAASFTCGWSWPAGFFRLSVEARSFEWTQNLRTHFSVWPFLLTILPAAWAKFAAVLVSLAVVLYVGAQARRNRFDSPEVSLLWAMVVTGTMLISPHLQYYDAGLLALPALLMVSDLLRRKGSVSRGTRVALAVGYLGYPLHALADTLGFQPLFIGLVALFAWNVLMLRET